MVCAGISPVHDLREKINAKYNADLFMNAPSKVLKHLDGPLFKASKNVTQNPQTEETLYQISKDLVSSILSKLEIQDKITRITREALEAPGKNKGITAIETRRILDYISRTLSGHILSITRASTEPELHRLVYGLSQIAAEVSIVSALKDITYATALSKKQSIDLSLRRRKRDISTKTMMSTSVPLVPAAVPTVYSVILNRTSEITEAKLQSASSKAADSVALPDTPFPNTPFAVFSRNERKPLRFLNTKTIPANSLKGFLNQTVLDMENAQRRVSNDSEHIVLEKSINNTQIATVDALTLEERELNMPQILDDWLDPRDNTYKSTLTADVAADIEIDQADSIDDDIGNEKRAKIKLEKLEVKAKKAILYAGDVAYLTAASVVAMRRALTASIEVHMSVRYAKNGMSNHQELMMNLAKTAAQQAGKEAKSATSKSLASERVIKLALKYTALSHGAKLNHVANRIVMDTLSLATLAKSMAFVSSDIAINSLYQATDVKPPS